MRDILFYFEKPHAKARPDYCEVLRFSKYFSIPAIVIYALFGLADLFGFLILFHFFFCWMRLFGISGIESATSQESRRIYNQMKRNFSINRDRTLFF